MSTQHSATSTEARRRRRNIFLPLVKTFLHHTLQGATSFELEQFFGLPHQSISAMLSKLEADGLVCRNGVTRISPNGCPAYAYFDLRYVEPEDREPVIRQGVQVVDWTADAAA
jgi:hypothetical protein